MKKVIGILFIMFLFISCDKDDTPNLKSTLTINVSNSLEVIEGDYFIFKFILTEVLAKDFNLNAVFSTEDVINYINDSDYSQDLEYSNDGGNTWKSGTDKSMAKFNSGTKELHIRIKTIDDTIPEVTEKFLIKFSPIVSSDIELNFSSVSTTTCMVKDNDVLVSSKPLLDGDDVLMIFSIDNVAKTHKIIWLTEKSLTEKKQKEIIDSEYKKIVTDLLNVLNLADEIKVSVFELYYGTSSGFAGFVYNMNTAKGLGTDDFIIAMNVLYGYYDVGLDNKTPLNEFNENGEYGTYLTHEFGHILTMNYYDQLKDTAGGNNLPCNTYVTIEGCAQSSSHLYNFYSKFYADTTKNFKNPTHVSNYAKTNIPEDLAETFAAYVSQENIPVSSDSSSGALQKLNFIAGRSLAAMKEDIKNIIYVKAPINEIPEVHAYSKFNYNLNSKRISCREVTQKRIKHIKSLIEMLEENNLK